MSSRHSLWKKQQRSWNKEVLMSELRVRRIQEFIKQEIGSMLLRDIKDSRLGFVTVTGVAVTGDFRQATVYVSLMGKDKEKKDSMDALQAAKGFIRREIGRRLQIYYSPEIIFEQDKSLDYGMRIDGILKKIQKDDETDGDK